MSAGLPAGRPRARSSAERGRAPAALVAGAALVAVAISAGVAPTAAAFGSRLDARTAAHGLVDVAQSADGAAQHETLAAARPLEGNGLPIRELDGEPAGRPSTSTSTVSIEVHNRSPEAVVGLRLGVLDLDDGRGVFSRLRFGVRVDGAVVGDGTPVRADRFAARPEGVDVLPRLEPGARAVVEVSAWLGPESTAADYGRAARLGYRIDGETASGGTISMEGEWT